MFQAFWDVCSFYFKDKSFFSLLPWHLIPPYIIIRHPNFTIRRELMTKAAKIKQWIEGFGGRLKNRQRSYLKKLFFPSLFI